MRNIPDEINSGFSGNYRAFWVVKVEGSGDNTFYWPTVSKNRTGHTFTLQWTPGVTVTPDSTMIAAQDLVTGDEYDGIGQMESGADLYSGGGVATVSDLQIDILNQARFDSTVIQAGINIENRPISIWFGFIPDGSGQTVVISTQMFERWAGVVEDVLDFDYQTFILRCVDGSFQRHKTIPTTVVNLNDYPNAPQTNIGKSIPIVYGLFGDTDTVVMDGERATETFSGSAPAIRIHDQEDRYVVSDHAIKGFIQFHMFLENNLFGTLTSPTTIVDSTGTFSWGTATETATITARIWQQPKTRGSGMLGTHTHANAVDGSDSTFETVSLDNVTTKFFLMLDQPAKVGLFTGDAVTLYVKFGTIDSTNGSVKLSIKPNAFTPPSWFAALGTALSAAFTSANNDSTQSLAFPSGIENLDGLSFFQVGLEGTTGTPMTAQVKNMYIEYFVFPQNLGRQTLFEKALAAKWAEVTDRVRRMARNGSPFYGNF